MTSPSRNGSVPLPNISSGPHVRNRLTTGLAMYDVILALCPAAVVGVWQHGFRAFLIIAMSIVSAVMTEFIFLCSDSDNTRSGTRRPDCIAA